MKNKITLISLMAALFLLMGLWPVNSQANNALKQEITLLEAIEKISKEYEVYFTFDMTLVVDVRVEYNNDSYSSAEEAISGILKGTNLKYQFYDQRFVILYKEDTEGLESLKEMSKHLDGLISKGEKKIKRTPIREVRTVPKLSTLALSKSIKPISFSVEGSVTDQEGEPLIGVNIQVKGTNKGTATDFEGRFTLEDTDENAVLVVSYIGYQTQEVLVAGKSSLSITMVSDSQLLDEVVVVGYGAQRKSDLTGSIGMLNMETKEDLPLTNVTDALRGSIAGVNVNSNGRPGQGGQLTIRGLNSLSAGNYPLIIVDGIPGSLSEINPNDIERIDVLKDGSSAAVYGAKSSNGVILVTTKRGKSEKPLIQYNGYYGIQNPSHLIKVLSPEKYTQKIIDYQHTLGVQNPDLQLYMQDLEYQNYLDGKTVDPIRFNMQNSSVQSHNVSVSGKNDRATYYLSGSFINDKGLAFNDNFQRFTLRANIENKITDWLKVGINSSYSSRDDSGIPGEWNAAVTLSPYSEMYLDDGKTFRRKVHGGAEQVAQSSVWYSARTKNVSKNQYLIGNIYAKVDFPFIKGLSYRLNYGNTFDWYKDFTFSPPYYLESFNDTGSGSKEPQESYDMILENILNYSGHFGEIHNIDATLLFSREHSESNGSLLSNSNFFTGLLGYNGLNLGTVPSVSTYAEESNGISTMFRVNYRMKDRYLLTFLIRRDGFSAFGKDQKFGLFPSAAGAWIVSDEGFMEGIEFIDNLKIRYSYGETGNQAIPPYASLPQMGQNAYVFGNGASTSIGLYGSAMGNDKLTWETTLSSNIGLDFGILNYRFSGSIEYYNSKTKNLLLRRSIPVMTGFTSVFTNIGGTSNKGFEMTINSRNMENNDWEWTSTIAFSTNKNKITSLYGLDFDGDGKEDDDIGNGWFIGEPLGAIYDYTLDGIYQIEDDIPTGFKPGYFRIKDLNDVPGIDPGDRSIIGKTTPDFRLSLGNTLTYKDWSLYVFINSSFGGMKDYEALNPAYYFPEKLNIIDSGPYWTPEHPNNTRPTISYAMPFSHGMYESLTFVRFQDASLSYEFPKELASRLGMQSLKVYLSGKNLLTFTEWSGWDPEVNGIGTDNSVGLYSQRGPIARSFVFGINLSL